MGNYCLSVTYECNWDCNYCCADTHRRAEPTFERIKKHLDTVEVGSKVSISGGEPGLAPREVMDYVFAELEHKQCRIHVNTNGVFFMKYKDLVPRVHEFLYHCSLDLRNKVWAPKGWETMNIDFMIVVADDTVDKLDEFLERNKHIPIAVYSADKYASVNGQPGVWLSHKNRIRAYQICKKHNIREDMIEFLFSKCKQVNDSVGLVHLP